MKLGEFIKTFIKDNSVIRLWKYYENGKVAMIQDEDGTDDGLCDWNILHIPQLCEMEVKEIMTTHMVGLREAINIVVITGYSIRHINHVISNYKNYSWDFIHHNTDEKEI